MLLQVVLAVADHQVLAGNAHLDRDVVKVPLRLSVLRRRDIDLAAGNSVMQLAQGIDPFVNIGLDFLFGPDVLERYFKRDLHVAVLVSMAVGGAGRVLTPALERRSPLPDDGKRRPRYSSL